MKRSKQSVPETGKDPKDGAPAKGKASQFWDFVGEKSLPPLMAAVGYLISSNDRLTIGGHWASGINLFPIFVASGLYFLAIVMFFRKFWHSCNATWKRVVLVTAALISELVFGWYDFQWIRREWTPTYVYLVPTHELIDCERRAFIVNYSGLKDLRNVKIFIKDNNNGTVQESDDFKDGFEAGMPSPDSPRYVWVKPSRPWDEDYTITVTGTRFHSVQEMVLRNVGQGLQSAVRIELDSARKPVVDCRDRLLPDAYSLGRGARMDCTTIMSVDASLLPKLRPEPFGYQMPDGTYTHVKLKALPKASELDTQSEDRHLTEYLRTVMKSKLSKYRGTKALILYYGGSKTLAYAKEFRDFLESGSVGWSARGPQIAPDGDEGIVDVQVSVSKQYWNKAYPRGADLMDSLEGVKHRKGLMYDDAVPADLIVLWVGPKSPDGFTPNDCLGAELRPRPGEHHTCEMVNQTGAACPFQLYSTNVPVTKK
jgi:hypothetical protein